ncbi:hypothetical protein Ancab_037306 [Ancistrocladus abbreviatus]
MLYLLNDRASTVGDAIDYIKELNRTVNELKLLVEKKRCTKERIKRHKADNNVDPAGVAGNGDVESVPNSIVKTEEVTLKLIQCKKINCLLYVSRTPNKLNSIGSRHVVGVHVGDYYSFPFNTKTEVIYGIHMIYEGSSVYASAKANRLIEAVERQYGCHFTG